MEECPESSQGNADQHNAMIPSRARRLQDVVIKALQHRPLKIIPKMCINRNRVCHHSSLAQNGNEAFTFEVAH
jgi:hypothetical protein